MDVLISLADAATHLLVAADHAMSAPASAPDYTAAGAPPVASQVLPITVLILLGLLIPAALMGANYVLSRFAIGQRNSNPAKNMPYESGLSSTVGDASERFSIKFYLVAMLFLAFDIEVAFLYAWAHEYLGSSGWGLFWVLLVFLVMLEVGYIYLYKKGALDWDR